MRTSRIAGVLAVVAVVFALAAAPLAAQHRQARDGFWIGFGMGYGSLGIGCDGCGGLGRTGGLSGWFRLGGTLAPNLLLGAETNGWYKSEDGATVTLGNASAALYFYPVVDQGLFLKAGLGYSRLEADDGISSGSEGGLGFVAGLGYDLRIGENTSITPAVNYFRGQFDGGNANVVQAGLGVTFH